MSEKHLEGPAIETNIIVRITTFGYIYTCQASNLLPLDRKSCIDEDITLIHILIKIQKI